MGIESQGTKLKGAGCQQVHRQSDNLGSWCSNMCTKVTDLVLASIFSKLREERLVGVASSFCDAAALAGSGTSTTTSFGGATTAVTSSCMTTRSASTVVGGGADDATFLSCVRVAWGGFLSFSLLGLPLAELLLERVSMTFVLLTSNCTAMVPICRNAKNTCYADGGYYSFSFGTCDHRFRN
jgi:hypothetical protein